MHRAVFVLLVAVVALVLADGEYYVPRSYYLIDSEGHATNPVPFRRLRRSLAPWPYSQATVNTKANANGLGDSKANANAEGRPKLIGSDGALGSAITSNYSH